MDDVRWALIPLAANMMRVVRGAGRSYELVDQCLGFLQACQAYQERVGHVPTGYELEEFISLRMRDDARLSRVEGRSTTVAGALQLAASLLLQQTPQMAAGEHEMWQGFRIYEEAREQRRAEMQAQLRAASKPGKRKPRKAKPTIAL